MRLRRRFLCKARSEPRAYPPAICKRRTTRALRKKIKQERLIQLHGYGLLHHIPALRGLPVIANCDFGHTAPVATLPNRPLSNSRE